jgi:dTMP kinase
MSARAPARFISLEGGEGTGKSTQARRLVAVLEGRGISCIATREPGGSDGAEEVRKLLVTGEPGRWDPLTETLLMFSARADHVARTIKPALKERRWVICDRFTDSTYAYQGAGRGVPRETIRRIESLVLNGFKPDLTLVLDLPVEIGLSRTGSRRTAKAEDRFERFDKAFHDRLRSAFLNIARRAPERCAVIDGSGDPDTVADAVWLAVRKRFRVR